MSDRKVPIIEFLTAIVTIIDIIIIIILSYEQTSTSGGGGGDKDLGVNVILSLQTKAAG